MAIIDKRKSFIVTTAHNFFGVSLQDDLESNEISLLERFLDQATCRTLYAVPLFKNSVSRVRLTNELSLGGNILVFFKISDSSVTEVNFHDVVQMTSISKNSATSLAEALRQVWSPALKTAGVDSLFLKKLQHELLGPKAIASLTEEEAFMRENSSNARTPGQSKLYEQAVLYLKNIRREMESTAVARNGLVLAEETLDTVSGYLDDLWKLKGPIYSEQRMQSLLDIVGDEVTKMVQSLLVKIQSADYQLLDRVMDESAGRAASICEKWVAMSMRMTELFWPHNSSHPWLGKPYKSDKCMNFGIRLKEIAEMRIQNRQLKRLLTESERASFETESMFKRFDKFEELLGDENEIEWNRLKDTIKNGLAPVEECVAMKIRNLIANANTAYTIETEFRRCCELMKRERLRDLLRGERQTLLSVYPDLLESSLKGPDTQELLDTPEFLQFVESARIAELRIQSLQCLGKELLDDLPGFDEILKKLSKSLSEVQNQKQELVETWVTETTESVVSKELTLSHDSAVVKLNGAKMMVVNFDQRLTKLIREGRGLASQGVELPREVQDLVNRASTLTGRARALQQVAHFHNTIGDRMIPSQRPLMLAAAIELAGAVREQSGVVWSDPRAVDLYTNRLRDLVRNFDQQNTELATKHAALRNLVINLLKAETMNMVTNQKTWKDTLKNMREIVSSVEANYGNTKAWKVHWDYQLLKVLGIAYRAALPNLVKKLPEIRVELTFRDNSLQWQPTFDDIRTKLYSAIRRFLAIPMNFRGVSEELDYHFKALVAQTAYFFGGVYKEAEFLLNVLESFRLKWLPLVAPAKIDTSQALKGKDSREWERAFKDAKQWAQEVSKLRVNEVKILCITVDTGRIRNDLESLSRRYWERLALDLRAEASSRLVSVVNFLSSASKKLSQRARTIEEIGEAYEAYSNIQNQSDQIAEELEDVTRLGKILSAWNRERLEGLSNAHSSWDSLKSRMNNYQNVMLHQLEEAKLNLRHQILAIHDEQERWNAKWTARPEVITTDWIEMMREKWTNITEQRDLLINDCKKLNLPVEEIFANDDKMVTEMEAELEAEELNCKFQGEFMDELKRQEEEEWSIAKRRVAKFHSWLDSWESQIELQSKNQREESLQEHRAKQVGHSYIDRRIKELRDSMEWLQLLRSEDLVEEHWNELKQILRLEKIRHMGDVTLGYLLQRSELIKENAERIKEVTKRAAAESGIRQALGELEAWESLTSLPLQESRNSNNAKIEIVKDYSLLLTRAGELRLILEGARGASGYERFASRASRCEASLHELEERIKLLSVIQRKWVYLEPVYSSGGAPSDSGRWARADKEFRYNIGEIAKDPRIPTIKNLPFHSLVNLKELMDRCQRSLDDFLEEKRSSYPRLYFLSDDDLLELISGKEKGLNVHLSKLYQGVGSIEKEKGYITGIISAEGEKLKLSEKINLSETFPKWLVTLEESIRNVLQQNLNSCLLEETPNILAYPIQILLLCERIRFTEKCEIAIEDDVVGLKNLLKYLENQRARYRGLEDPRDELKSLKVKNLLLETVHHFYIVQNLLKVITDKEKLMWNWNRQLRTYKNGGGAVIRCVKAEFSYCFEYQGAGINLVRTPLTEKCYLALTQAMKLGLGGSPTGPAGTGKTESVKALGSILGRRVLVFNCDEGMDSGSMRRILSGLAQAGAWGCFDEFNRLDESTMSAVGMLIRPLQAAIRDGASKVNLGGLEISVDPNCCLFITMNPAGDDYGGRQKLPDSLARLFRPIGMAHPNKTNIVRTLLECGGFTNASTLANQLVETFDTAEKLLSKQPHYDWGLRALRSVLDAITTSTLINDQSNEIPRILSGIHVSTMPKLVERDKPIFLSLLTDIFPAVNLTLENIVKGKEKLGSILENIIEAQGLHKSLVSTCIQLNDQLKSRSGIAIVGPPGCGKSLIIKILAEALLKSGVSVKQFQIYPGAISKSKLFGTVDSQTREFKEGLISNIISNSDNNPLWIIFNGDVEPIWAEALNSALDDNRILTLPNGVGMKLGIETRFIFESHKLSGASPATVSRLGIVYLGEISPSIFAESEIMKNIPPVSISFITSHLFPVIERVLKIKKEQKSLSGLLNTAMCHFKNANTQTSCTYALLVSMCGQIEDFKLQAELARTIYQFTNNWCPDSEYPFDAVYNKEKDILDPFTNYTKTMQTENGLMYISGSMQRGVSAILPWIKSGQAIILRGPSGCGKNSLLSILLTLIINESDESILVVKGSSLYGSKDLMTRLKRACIKLDSTSGRIYKPKNGSSLILVMTDLHSATKSLQELIRQLIQEGGLYEDDLEFAKIPVSIISTGDSSTQIHPRLDSLLASHYLPIQKPKDLDAILELHLKESLRSEDSGVKAWIAKMSPIIFEAFNEILTEKSSVKWTFRDLIKWVDLLKYYPKPENEADITDCLIDASRRLFRPKLVWKQQKRLETVINSRSSASINFGTKVYVWKGPNPGLTSISESEWKAEVENAVTRCIREGDSMSTNTSSYLLEIAAGISWALGCEQRGLVLVGRPGAGRRTATKIIAAISSLRLIDSGPGKGKSCVKSAIQAAGVDGEPTILLIEEHHLREEEMAIVISGIISNGEMAGLYTSEELDGLVAPLADLAAKEEFSGSLDQFLNYRLRKYLRVALIVDAHDSKESHLSESNIFHHCVQTTGQSLGSEWWLIEESLMELANIYKDTHKELEEEFSGIKEIVGAHLSAPTQQQAPARFIALLHKWKELRETWLKEISDKLKNLEGGIDRLKEAGDRVAKLEEDATKQRRELEMEKGRANATLEQITATMRGATGQRGEMTNLKMETERESEELARRKADIENELGKVEPLVAQAAQAVAGISADALSEVRSLRAPPAPVRDVLEGVLRLMGIRDTSWNSMKTFLAKRGVKEEIRNWDARRSTTASLDAVAKLIREKPESFEDKTAKRASIAAAPLAAWVLANLQYGQILQQVAPLEREQRLLANRLMAAEMQLGKLETGLNTVESKVAQLQEELAAHSRGAAELQLRSEATESSLATARALLAKLDVEHKDWQMQFQTLTERKLRIGMEAANAAALLIYQYHQGKKDEKRKHAMDLLISERERLQWRAQGLPVDMESLIGATRSLRGNLVPLFVDPLGIALNWLKHNIGESRLEVTRPGDVRFLTSVELAIRFDKPLLVEEILEMPPILLPLLRRRPLRIGDRILPTQPSFQLFLATRQEGLLEKLPSEADAVLVKISLGSGSRSLAERLVEKAILQETPEVEHRRRKALEREEQLSGEIEAARLELLVQLGAARGQDMLQESQNQQGGSLLATLEVTQSKAKEIARALEDSRRDLEDIVKRSKEHDRLAKFTAILYKFVRSFAMLNSLYVFTTEVMTDIFLEAERSRANFKASSNRDEREKFLERSVIMLTLSHCTKAAYRKHRLPLALHLALSLSSITEEQRNLLLSGESAYISSSGSEIEIPNGVPRERELALRALISTLPEMLAKFKSSWINNISNIYADDSVGQFEKILTIQALHPEHLHTALTKWAAQQLGVRNLTPPAWTLKQIAQDNPIRPVLLLLSPGADPGPELSSLVERQILTASGFVEVSLGQGHVAQAESALEAACNQGSWILLSNLQLALNWLPRLEALLRSPSCTAHKNPNTRIWLTTEECTGFYSGLSGLCLKLAYEPPEGVKRNVKRSLQQLQQRQPTIRDPCKLLMIAWLHAVLQERRKFVPQGWIKAYAWSEADLEAACELVVKKNPKHSMKKYSDDWEADRGILSVVIYGGLLQDEYDMRMLKAVLRQIWSKDMYSGRRKLGSDLSVPRAESENPLIIIDKINDADSLQAYFGLPANAYRAWEKSSAELTLKFLREILRRTSRVKGGNADANSSSPVSKTINDIKLIIDQQRINDLSDSEKDLGRLEDDPLQRFFTNEMRTTSQLLQLIRSGANILYSENGLNTPEKWISQWYYGPREVIPFVNQLILRYQSLKSLTGLPDKVQLSWFARPDAFLSAFKQYTSRKTRKPFENLQLQAKWTKDFGREGSWQTSIIVEGLLLTGARIQNGILEEVTAHASSVVTAPACLIAFLDHRNLDESDEERRDGECVEEDAELTADLNTLQVPVYADSLRSHLVCSLPVPYMKNERDIWHQRGISFHLRSN